MKGLSVSIYSDGFIDGLSPIKEARRAIVIDKDLPELFSVTPDAPALRIVRRELFGGEYIHAEPYEPGSYAFGGRFIYTSDSRFRKLNKYPIPLHDRNMDLEAKF
jgi:hypothetical protein